MTEQLSATPEIPDKEPTERAIGMLRTFIRNPNWGPISLNDAAFILHVLESASRTSESVPREELTK